MDDPELTEIRARKLQRLLSESSTRQDRPVEWSGPLTLTDATFSVEVRKSGLILVDFWAEWCGPCHQVAPILDQIARARADTLRLGKLNVDENPRTAERFGVMSIPTMLLFKDGKLVDSIVGALPRAQIESVVARWT